MRFDLRQNRTHVAAPKRCQFDNLVPTTSATAAFIIAIRHVPRFPGARIVRSDPLCYPHFDYARKRAGFPLLSYQKVNDDDAETRQQRVRWLAIHDGVRGVERRV